MRWFRERMILMYRPAQGSGSGILRFLRRLLLIDVVIFAIVGGLCLSNEAWRNIGSFSDGLLMASGLLLAAGVMFMYGNWMQTGNFSYQYGMTAGVDDLHTRAQRTLNDRSAGVRSGLQVMVYALLPLLVSLLLDYI
ncbi:MAG: hypothetical protein JW910_01925 [Anaerolineae bacterium]|nr:hypothetical protein [Anaerolineae bacterium]